VHSHPHSRSAALAALAVLALAGCGGDGSPATPRGPQAAVKSEHAMPTTPDSPLIAGLRYVSKEFRSGLTLTLPDGAWVGQDTPAGITMRYLPPAPIRQGILSVNHITKVFDPRRGGRTIADAVPAPPDFATWLERHPRLTASKPVAVTLDGLHGVQVDVTPKSFPARHPAECDPPEELPCLPVWFAERDGVVYPENTKTRFLVLDDDQGRQLVVEAFADPADAFPTVWPVMSDALKTVRFPAH